MKRLTLILVLSLVATATWAAPTRYVTDELQINMRSGATNNHRIIKLLDAGTPLEILETAADGWTRARAAGGVEGWILTRYISATPSARDRLSRATSTLERAQQELAALRKNMGSESQRLEAAQRQVAQLTTANEQMKRQLGEAARGVAMANENRELKKQAVDVQREIEMLQNESERLRDRSQRDWFVAGALVIFGGFLAGIIVTRIRWKKKSAWGSL